MSTERNMKNENFVTFEVAKLLQDKGYREDCHASYKTDETGRSELTVVFGLREFRYLSRHVNGFQYEYLAPTLYAAQKWVRTKGKIHIVVELNKHGWYYRLYDMEDLSLISQMEGYTDTFEKALNDGIKESLTYLQESDYVYTTLFYPEEHTGTAEKASGTGAKSQYS